MYSTELAEQVTTLRKQNKSIKEIAQETNKSEISIRIWLSRHKIYKIENKLKLINELTDLELAYIAGIIDGEGSIIISKLKPSKGEISTKYQLFCKVVNTSEKLIRYLSEKTLQPFFYDAQRNRPNSRPTYSIHWPVNITIHLLDKIYPYLVIKKDQVDLAKKFRETFMSSDTKPNILKQRYQYYLDMKALHKK